MEKIKSVLAHNFLKTIKWVFLILVGLFIIVVIGRAIYFFNLDRTNVEVEKIHATKLTLEDVMGDNLPPDPGAQADKTIIGIDVNENGIRDDVELAVFKEYPNSAKTRAVLLQYALALQMEVVQTIVNTKTVTEISIENSRAHACVGDTLVPREDSDSSRSSKEVEKIYEYIGFVENEQFNIDLRKKAHEDFYKLLRSFSESTNEICDINVLTLPN